MEFSKGQRVKILPHTDQFMMGELYGVVTSVRRRKNPTHPNLWSVRVFVRGERSGRRFNMHPTWIEVA